MKYQKIIDQVKSGNMTRADLAKLKQNAEQKFANGDKVIRSINLP